MSPETPPTIDRSTDAGDRAAERLEREAIAWLATVRADGTPQVSPVWFLWDDAGFLVYSRASARVTNIRTQPRVGLNLDGNGRGGDIVVVEGIAHIDNAQPSPAENPTYLDKYGERMASNNWSPAWFATNYPVPIVIIPTRYRVW